MKVAVIGCGYWGKNLVRNFFELGVLSAVVDQSEVGRKQAEEIAPDVKVYDNYHHVMKNSDIDSVIIATPAHTHAALCEEALKMGKDVFCEKPLALNFSEAECLVELAHINKKILMVGHIMEYHPAILKMQELIKRDAIGKVQYIYSNRLNLGKVRREENILWSFAPHDIAIILRLLGMMPLQVMAHGGSYLQPNIADVTVTQLLFDNGVNAHIFVSWLNPFKEQRLVVIGSKSMLTFNDVTKELILHDKRVDIKDDDIIPVKGAGENIKFDDSEPLSNECKAFLDAIDTRKSPLTDGESAVRVLRVLQGAQQSLMTKGQPVLMNEEENV